MKIPDIFSLMSRTQTLSPERLDLNVHRHLWPSHGCSTFKLRCAGHPSRPSLPGSGCQATDCLQIEIDDKQADLRVLRKGASSFSQLPTAL